MTDGSTGNILLHAIQPDTLHALGAEKSRYHLGDVLTGATETPRYVYFPSAGSVASIVCTTNNGSTVEAGVVGSEGAVSVNMILMPPRPTGYEAIVQNAGEFTRIGTDPTREYFQVNAEFRGALLAYTGHYLDQITQHSVCNRLHPIEQRLAKWILTMRDRVESDELHLTQEFLAHMLGIHRPGVSIAVSALELDGLITHSRNRITIRDRAGLMARSCECYGIVHASLERLRINVRDVRSQAA